VEQGVTLDALLELLDFFFHFIDVNVFVKMKEMNLYLGEKGLN
jgi:hypothetical protein